MPKDKKKTKVDSRFKSKLKHDNNYSITPKFDKQGRPVNKSNSNNEIYEYSSDSDAVSSNESDVSSDIFDDDILDKIKDEDELDEFLSEETAPKKKPKQVQTPGKPLTDCRRLALRNLQWNIIGAEDILQMLNSFIPPTSAILKVEIQPSKQGMKRIQFEAKQGPYSRGIFKKDQQSEFGGELVNNVQNESLSMLSSKKSFASNKTSKSTLKTKTKSHSHLLDADDLEEEGAYDKKKLRKYEFSKLLWQYAIITCDNALTANQLFNELQDQDIDIKSNIKMAFEFVPEQITDFTQDNACPLKESCTQVSPDQKPKFQDLLNIYSSLNSTKVQNTYDADDEQRYNALMLKQPDEEQKLLTTNNDEKKVATIFNKYKPQVASDSEDDVEETKKKQRRLIEDLKKDEKAKDRDMDESEEDSLEEQDLGDMDDEEAGGEFVSEFIPKPEEMEEAKPKKKTKRKEKSSGNELLLMEDGHREKSKRDKLDCVATDDRFTSKLQSKEFTIEQSKGSSDFNKQLMNKINTNKLKRKRNE